MDALGAPNIGERTEAKLISDFVEKIGQLRPAGSSRSTVTAEPGAFDCGSGTAQPWDGKVI